MGLTVGSLFSGIGGLDLGIERAGMTVAWQAEQDAKCRSVLARHWPDVHCCQDVRDVTKDATRVDVLCGGFPCQDLSVAGRRAGLGGRRSGLFFEFDRIARVLAPRWLLIENVPGLLSSNGGRDMGAVVGALADLGYGFAWRVLDAQWFGLAQRRKRLFIVGCAGGDGRRAAQVLLEPARSGRDDPPRRTSGQDVAGTLGGGSGSRGWCDDLNRAGAFIPELSHCLRSSTRGTSDADRDSFIAFDPAQITSAANRTNPRPGGQSPTLTAGPVLAFDWQQGGEGVGTTYVDGTINTLSTSGHGSVMQSARVRRLIPVERERLQGFPDGWTDGHADSARERMTGNAVAVPVAEWIGRRILDSRERMTP